MSDSPGLPHHLTHLDAQGKASMVDISSKPDLHRTAVATGFLRLQPATSDLIQNNAMKKGDVIAVARIAGIMAAKKTQELIPLCHQIPLSRVSVDFAFEPNGIRITAEARTIAPTGVEMEALTAVSIAALTLYDMSKAVDKSMVIEGITLVSKTKEIPPPPTRES